MGWKSEVWPVLGSGVALWEDMQGVWLHSGMAAAPRPALLPARRAGTTLRTNLFLSLGRDPVRAPMKTIVDAE